MIANEPHAVRMGTHEVLSLNLAKCESGSAKEMGSPIGRVDRAVRVGTNEVLSLNLAKCESGSAKDRGSPIGRVDWTPLG